MASVVNKNLEYQISILQSYDEMPINLDPHIGLLFVEQININGLL